MRTGVAVGFFDGVHLGHRAILADAYAALTFRHHPLAVLAPARAPRLLMSSSARLAAIRATGVPQVVALEFDRTLAALPPEDFAARFLASLAGPGRTVRCGADWHFGRGGEGDAALLRRLGYRVEVVPDVVVAGGRVSSTRIRTTLEAGDVTAANAMLGRTYAVVGTVSTGKGRGRTLGFPTVNVVPDAADGAESVRLPLGVYVVDFDGRPALANYGLAPTMGAESWSRPVLEVHIPDVTEFPCETGRRVSVGLVRFLRPERRFASEADLARQIAADLDAFRKASAITADMKAAGSHLERSQSAGCPER